MLKKQWIYLCVSKLETVTDRIVRNVFSAAVD